MGLNLRTKPIKLTRDKALSLARELKKVLQKDTKTPYGVYLRVNAEGKKAIQISEPLGYGSFQGVSNYLLVKPLTWEEYARNGVATQKQLEEIIYKEGNKQLKEKYDKDVWQEVKDNYLYEWARNGKRQKDIQAYVYASLDNDKRRETIYRGRLSDDALVSINLWVTEQVEEVVGDEDVKVTYIGVNEIRNEVADGTTRLSVARIHNYGSIYFEIGIENNGKFKRFEMFNYY